MKKSASVFGLSLALALSASAAAPVQWPAKAPVPQNDYTLAPGIEAPAATAGRGAKTKAISSIADLAGEYAMVYTAATSSSYDGGSSVTIAAIEGTDSVTLTGFYEEGAVVKAKADLTAMTLSIPNQVIGYDSTTALSDYDITYYDATDGIDRTANITATISTDGTLTITDYWGVFVVEGDYANYYYGIYYGATIEPANATMSYYVYDSGTTTTYTYNAVVTQVSESELTVKNFYNAGHTITFTLKNDSTAIIEKQVVYANSIGNWYTYSMVYADDYSGVSSYSTTITCDAAPDARTITWGGWNIMCTYSGTLYWTALYITGAKVETTFDIVYPEQAKLTVDGEGTAESPYLIKTTSDWNNIADYMAINENNLTGKYVRLENDLDWSSDTIKPFGYNREETFDGDFDGNGKTIKGLSLTGDASYFGSIMIETGENCYLHDLTVEGDITTSVSYTGGIAAYFWGKMENVTGRVNVTTSTKYSGCIASRVGLDAIFINVVNEGNLTSSTTYNGGMFGYSRSGAYYESCVNKGTVTYTGSSSSSYTGGLIASAYDFTMLNCHNEGSIVGTDESSGYLCGLVAYITSSSSDSLVHYFINCYNTGDITGGCGLGGCFNTGSSYARVQATNCYNTGNITAVNTASKTVACGGLSSLLMRTSTYRNCWNSGKVTAATSSNVGGVFGNYSSSGSESKKTYIIGCYNIGEVSAPASQYVGGVLGHYNTYTYLDSCYNTGNVSGGYCVGGIVGQIGNSTTTIDNCWNAGEITGASTAVGGLIGYCAFQMAVTNCFNVGNVTSTSQIRGNTTGVDGYAVGGIAGHGGIMLSNAFNTGDIEGQTGVGGLIGTPYKSRTTITNCYSSGTVTAPSDTIGNILGTGTLDESFWTSSNSMSGTYYLKANGVTDEDEISKGLTYAELATLSIGDGWTAGDDYTYPIPTVFADNDYAKAYTAAVVPADGDSYTSITQGFYVGAPDGVTWSASPAVVEVSGNTAAFTEAYTGTLTMTATCGDAVATTELTCAVTTVGVSNILGSNSAMVMNEKFYTVGGAQVAEPADGQKAIYIVVKTYDDGTTETVKEIR